jgi:hypothetical protein
MTIDTGRDWTRLDETGLDAGAEMIYPANPKASGDIREENLPVSVSGYGVIGAMR